MVVTWAYNSGTNTATASGAGSTNFAALVAADTAGGWGKFTADATGNVIMCTGKVYIGDGTNAAVLTDTSKQIIFSNGLGSNFLRVQANSTLTLGVLDNAAQYRTSRGCSLCYYDTTNTRGQIQGSGTVNLYGCHIFSNNTGAYQGLSLYAIGTLIAYNCVFSRALVQEANTNTKIFNAQFMKPPFGAVIFTGSPALFSKVSVTDSGESVIYSYRNVTALNPYGRNCVYTVYLNANNHNITINLVNPDIDNRHFFFTGAYVAGSRINEQYEFDLQVCDNAESEAQGTVVPIEGADVTLFDKDGNEVFNETSDEDGWIPTQTVSRGYYAQSTGDTLQDYGPHFLLVTKEGFEPYMDEYILTEKRTNQISMNLPGVPADLATATSTDVLTSKTFFGKAGTLETGTYEPPATVLTGNADPEDVLAGKTFYKDDAETQLTGTGVFQVTQNLPSANPKIIVDDKLVKPLMLTTEVLLLQNKKLKRRLNAST